MTNYSKGANFERRIQHYYDSLNYLTIRSAGSHSPIDLLAIPKGDDSRPFIAIQCKSYKKTRPKPDPAFIALKIPATKVWATKKFHKPIELEVV